MSGRASLRRAASPGRLVRVARRARRLSWADRREVAVALVLATVIEIALRAVRLPSLARRLGVPLDVTAGASADPAEPADRLPDWAARRLYFANRVMDRWPMGGTCLRRSLLAGARLRALNPALRIGVNRAEGFRAHAWIEIDGKSLDPSAAEFATLEELGR